MLVRTSAPSGTGCEGPSNNLHNTHAFLADSDAKQQLRKRTPTLVVQGCLVAPATPNHVTSISCKNRHNIRMFPAVLVVSYSALHTWNTIHERTTLLSGCSITRVGLQPATPLSTGTTPTRFSPCSLGQRCRNISDINTSSSLWTYCKGRYLSWHTTRSCCCHSVTWSSLPIDYSACGKCT